MVIANWRSGLKVGNLCGKDGNELFCRPSPYSGRLHDSDCDSFNDEGVIWILHHR